MRPVLQPAGQLRLKVLQVGSHGTPQIMSILAGVTSEFLAWRWFRWGVDEIQNADAKDLLKGPGQVGLVHLELVADHGKTEICRPRSFR